MDRIGRVGLRGRRLAVAAVIAGIGVAGCGSSTSKPKLTKAEFLQKGNAICTTGNAALQRGETTLGNNPTRAQIEHFVDTVYVPSIQTQISSILALAAQTADKAKLTSIIDLAQADLNKIKSDPLVIVGPSGAKLFSNFASQAHPYGLTACAQNS
jgi:hypothetical protein